MLWSKAKLRRKCCRNCWLFNSYLVAPSSQLHSPPREFEIRVGFSKLFHISSAGFPSVSVIGKVKGAECTMNLRNNPNSLATVNLTTSLNQNSYGQFPRVAYQWDLQLLSKASWLAFGAYQENLSPLLEWSWPPTRSRFEHKLLTLSLSAAACPPIV